MTTKRIVERHIARQDIEAAVDHYFAEAGEAVALGFVEALETAYRLIANHPAAGSARYALELNLPDLRVWRLRRYPYLIFYVERASVVEVWRVLHGHSDIPAWMRDAEDA